MTFTYDPTTRIFSGEGLEGLPHVTSIISPLNEYAGIAHSLGGESVLQKAAARGRAVHAATEEHDRQMWKPAVERVWRPDQSPTFDDPVVVPYLTAWLQFLLDTKFEVHTIEEPVVSRKYRYGGVLDRTGVLHGHRCVLEIKTTVNINPQTGVQLAAYQAAVNEERKKLDQYHKRYACQLKRDGTYRLHEFTDRADWSVFLALLTLYNWRARYQKGAGNE